MRAIVKTEDGKLYGRYSTVVMGMTHPFMPVEQLKDQLKDEDWTNAYSGFDNAKTIKELQAEGCI